MKTLTNAERNAVLGWFKGKAQESATYALGILNVCLENDGWMPAASRKVKASLGKPNVANAIAKANAVALESINHYMVNGQYNSAKADLPESVKGRSVESILRYGALSGRGSLIDFPSIRAAAEDSPYAGPNLQAVLHRAQRFVKDMQPVVDAIKLLDATRPKPVFTKMGASPTVTRTLQDLGFEGIKGDVEVCPIEWTLVERNGKFFHVGRLLWPEGTKHNVSRYNWTDHNKQCQACGHAIQNPFNWVPLIIRNEAGVPHSLWVGRDCGRTLFHIEVKGEVELEGRE